jgi:hypothetical protein
MGEERGGQALGYGWDGEGGEGRVVPRRQRGHMESNDTQVGACDD